MLNMSGTDRYSRAEARSGFFARWRTRPVVFAALVFLSGTVWETHTLSAPAQSNREAFNEAVARLHEGKLHEAETLLDGILETQDDAWRVPALYNLGHARFGQGMEELKKAMEPGPSAARGRAKALSAEEMITDGQAALRAHDMERLVSSYMRGRGIRRELRAAMKQVGEALQTYANVLNRLERASGDWKSAVDLDPANADARHNADVVDRHIARIIDSFMDMQQSMQMMQRAGEELKQMLSQMKGRIPKENMPPGAEGDEEEDEEGGMEPPKTGQEPPGSEGQERQMSREEAGWMLEGFRFGQERRLPMTRGAEGQPKDRNRPTW